MSPKISVHDEFNYLLYNNITGTLGSIPKNFVFKNTLALKSNDYYQYKTILKLLFLLK